MYLPLYGEQCVSLCQALLQLVVDGRRRGPLGRKEGNGELSQSLRINIIGHSSLEIGSGEVVGRSGIYDGDHIAHCMESTRQLYPITRACLHYYQSVGGGD